METTTIRKVLAMAGFGAATAGAAALGAVFPPDSWFRRLQKPWFQPPDWVFAPVWTALYTMIAISGYRVWRAPPSQERTLALGFWGAQLGLNAAWTWLFFGRHDPRASLADLHVLRAAVDVYDRSARAVDPAAGWLMAPYRGWLTFASALNAEIVRQNS